MVNYVEILRQNPNGVLATNDGGSVKTRVFQFLFAQENKMYFCTNSQKPVYDQLVKNPNVSFCTHPADFSKVLSLSGKVVFADDMELKKRALDENPPIKGMYETADNPVFKLFYIEVKEIETFDFQNGTEHYTV